jgi:hypothetical protein
MRSKAVLSNAALRMLPMMNAWGQVSGPPMDGTPLAIS